MTNSIAATSRADRLFHLLCPLCAALPLGQGAGAGLGSARLRRGWTGFPGWWALASDTPTNLVLLEVWGQMEIVGVAAALAFPVGIGVAVYLEHVAHRGFFATIARRTIALLAAVPSVLYALCGVTVLVVCLDVRSKFVTLACCLALFLFPIVVERTRAALQTVSPLIHEASLALGADPFRAIVHVILPLAMPALASEMLLILARALGTVAPLLVVDVFTPRPKVDFIVPLSVRIFRSGTDPHPGHQMAAATAVLLLLILVVVLHVLANWLSRRNSFSARRAGGGLSERGAA